MSRFNPIRGAPSASPQPEQPAAPKPKLVVGSRVHCILYGGMDGIVHHIRGEQKPETIGDMSGIVTYGGNAHFDIVFTGTRAHLSCVPESIVHGVQWRILDGVATQDEINEALAHEKVVRAAAEAKAKEHSAELQRRADEYCRQWSGILQAGTREYPACAKLAAVNIRTELKRAFPGVKFSVRSDHNSVDVGWELGPVEKEVKKITDKYQEGHFNGMEDIYEDDADDVWTPIFGGAKYVNESRHIPEPLYEQIARDLCALQHVEYEGTYTRNLMGRNDCNDLSYYVHQLTQRTEFPPGAKYKGVEAVPWTQDRPCNEWCRILFELPATPAPTEKFSSFSSSSSSVTLKPNAEKNGLQLHFASKPSEEIRSELKAAGWRWSRFNSCWYHRDTPSNLDFAQRFVARFQAPTPPPIVTVLPDPEPNHVVPETKPPVVEPVSTLPETNIIQLPPSPTPPRPPAWKRRLVPK